ncbi:MAG TPA: EI24 domain-containing protein [Rhodopila sp.]|nr:EI24 domain-containing protein [Rhodopila sp.]
MWSQQPVLAPILRAVSQLGDPTFVGVLWRSVAWSAACLVGLYAAAISLVHQVLELHGIWAWAADLLSTVGAALLATWLFLPVAAAIGTLYIERIAIAVERRFYPWLPAAHGASIAEQTWDGIAVAVRVLAFSVLGLILAVVLPGAGLVLGWLIASYAFGRGLFAAVAMRRMNRADAEALYRYRRGTVLVQGAILALASYVPLLNLLIPLVGTAAMVHVLDAAMTTRFARYPDSIGASS